MKKARLILLVPIALAVLVGGASYWWVSRSGSVPASITRWVGQQLQTIANWHLNPTLTFDDLTYTYPSTVSAKNIKLTAADPAHPGQTISILSATEMTLELAEIPRTGQPIAMRKIILRNPVFLAVAERPGSPRLIGFSDLLKPAQHRKQQPQPPGVKLSEVFQMRRVEIIDGRIVYDPRIQGRPPMQLDQIRLRMDLDDPVAGSYALRTSLTRAPVFDISIAAKLNLDTLVANDLAIQLKANLAPGQQKYLPSDLQKLLNDHEVSGELSTTIAGSVAFPNFTSSTLHADASLVNANVSLGDHRVPIDSLSLNAALANRTLDISRLDIAALHGQSTLTGSVALDDSLTSDLRLQVRNVLLQDTLRTSPSSAETRYAGRVNADITVKAPLATVFDHINPTTLPQTRPALPDNWGGGTLTIDQGRLVNIPALQSITAALAKAAKAVGAGSSSATNDRAELQFTFASDHIQFNQIKAAGSYLAVRGDGQITLDQNLNLKLAGGPIEKVGSLFGDTVGGAVAKVTGALASYHVTGTIKNPQVNVEFAGESLPEKAGKAADAIEEGAGKAIDSADKGAKKLGDAIKGLFD
jgi:hypothetical protein